MGPLIFTTTYISYSMGTIITYLQYSDFLKEHLTDYAMSVIYHQEYIFDGNTYTVGFVLTGEVLLRQILFKECYI